MSRTELADFLRRRREALSPERSAGPAIHPPGRRARRTPGLRREEVAALAGMSTSYYERLEQARAPHPSPQVLAALGSALQLDAAEREHLARLAGQAPPPTAPQQTRVPHGARRLLAGLGASPAYLTNERQDILAWNAAAVALIADLRLLPPEERNVIRLAIRLNGTLCTAPPGEEGAFARASAAHLRVASARHPFDSTLSGLVNEFAAHSEDFAAGWRDHEVRPVPTLRKRLHHPEAGELQLDCHTLLVPGTDLRLAVYSAEPGTASATALDRLTTDPR
ncbi:helix-turn-helix transcriptional regulator [Streptomyces profundus]|uniref:helix-turn-helix transcriptional regulator n=1 Tax=Streptomyces profundus TaxID=2867410 RepID=UPI001D16E83D|nr:helix-turn-helix transcriptional regulator [Streptomyces sp. MA3_2.13]UED83292.1 helix-turn-helix transcriptional regulator [Streptomyces sp. MA3_2.13]